MSALGNLASGNEAITSSVLVAGAVSPLEEGLHSGSDHAWQGKHRTTAGVLAILASRTDVANKVAVLARVRFPRWWRCFVVARTRQGRRPWQRWETF